MSDYIAISVALYLLACLIFLVVRRRRDPARHYYGHRIFIDGECRTIIGYDPTTKTATFTPSMDKAPKTGDTFLLREEKP